ncbi:MAG TPA: RiPP maturation radical SAM C-methyltransferase, partial [Solirubrobacterales bacterium]|nr:RiPP maturation radical SAM C-methyltransferase [Solirubrobacterales bacterium]
ECPPAALEQLARARRQVDPFLDECLEAVGREDWELVGFSSSFTQNMASLALARELKARRPEVRIAFGGANCEDLMGLALHQGFPFLDLVFCGEADITLPRAVAALAAGEGLESIPGLVWRDPGDGGSRWKSLAPEKVKDLDELPYPDYDDFFSQCDQLPQGSRIAGVPMETSRGCWWGEKHHCTFCGLNGLSMAFRSKTPERALAELDHLLDRYRVSDVQMVDNILDMGYVKTFLPMLAEREVKPALFYETKANLTPEQLAVFRAAGIRAIQAGVESLDTRVLKLMDKGTTGIRSIELLKHCREIGIWPHWNILYGFPGEPPEAYGQMAREVEGLRHLDPPNVCTRFRLDRFSPLFVRAGEMGIDAVRPARAYELLYDLPPEGVRALAYYFEFDYRDGRDPDAYAEPLRDAVAAWQEEARGDLVHLADGGATTILDTRGGRREEFRLEGAESDLYQYCATARPLPRIEEEFGSRLGPRRLRSVLDAWLQARLAIELDGRCLALAVDAEASRRWRHRRKPSWQEVLDESLGTGAGKPRRALFSGGDRQTPVAS